MGLYRATYFDGKSAADWDVVARPAEDGLRIEAKGAELLALWPYDTIEVIDEVIASNHLRLRRKNSPARLTVTDPGLLDELPADVGAARQAKAARRRLGRSPILVMIAICAAAALLWAGFPLAVRVTAAAIPVAWERALGDWVLDDVLDFLALFDDGEAQVCEDEAGRAALAALTQELAAASGSPYDFRVLVVDFDMTNAFALPGGAIVIFDGLIEFAATPDEVAGVLAHEMAHVMKRHGTEALLRSYGLQLLIESLTGSAGGGVAGGLGETLLGLSYGRDAESEADRVGIELLQTAGLRADGLGRFFERFGE
ncbi:MAG: M48 family metallopeptidase, partial [Kiloniellales bacterium]|nr:M48 family metallopeptidase [Kiloniellales bacterium]